MNCAEFKENVAAFALDALEPEERAACEAHLASTATHDGCLEALRRATETAAALGESLPPVRPPDRVWDAITSEVLSEASVADVPANPTEPPARSRMRPVYHAHRPVAERHLGTPRSRARFWREGVAWGLAAAAALAVVFLSARHRTIHEHLGRAQHELGLSRGQLAETLARLERIEGELGARIRAIDVEREACLEDLAIARVSLTEKEAVLDLLSAPDTQLIHLAAQGEVSSRASALLNSAREQAILLASALEPQPGKDYQLWLIRGDRKISAGLLPVDASGLPILARIAPDLLADGTPDALAITVEPAGGMPQPTGPIVLVGSARA